MAAINSGLLGPILPSALDVEIQTLSAEEGARRPIRHKSFSLTRTDRLTFR